MGKFGAAILLVFSGCMGPPPRFEGEVGRGTSLWPICEVVYGPDGRETSILWPILSFDNKADHKLYAVRPLFIVRTDPEARMTSGDFLFPILHLGHTGTRNEHAFRPFFGVWRDPVEDMTDIDFLFPFGYYRSEPKKSWFQLRPFVWSKRTEESGYFHLFPLYGKNWEKDQRRIWLLTPLITHWRDSSKKEPTWTFNALWPLLHLEAGQDLRKDWAIPFFYRSRSGPWESLMATPFYWEGTLWTDRTRTAIQSHTLVIPPIYGRGRFEERSWLWIGPNLLISQREKDSGSVHVFFPFIYHGWKPDSSDTWVFPFYFRMVDPDGTLLVIPPFFRRWSKTDELMFLWPAFGYRRKDDYREYSTLYPLFWYGSDGNGAVDFAVLGPILHHSTEHSGDWAWDFLFPFGNTSKSGDETHARLFPLFLWWRDPSADTYSFHFLWPFFSVKRGGRDRRSVDLFAPLIEFSRNGEDEHSRFFPFYLYWKDGAEKSEWLHVLWPLVRWKATAEETSFRLLLPYITDWHKGDEHDFRVFWKWIRSTREKDFSTLRINPFYRRDENSRGDVFWSVLGGLVSRKQAGGEVTWKALWFIPL